MFTMKNLWGQKFKLLESFVVKNNFLKFNLVTAPTWECIGIYLCKLSNELCGLWKSFHNILTLTWRVLLLNSEMKQWWKHGMNEKLGQKRTKSWNKGQRIDEKSYNPISILWWVLRINQLLSHTGDFSMGVERLEKLRLCRGSLNVSWF